MVHRRRCAGEKANLPPSSKEQQKPIQIFRVTIYIYMVSKSHDVAGIFGIALRSLQPDTSLLGVRPSQTESGKTLMTQTNNGRGRSQEQHIWDSERIW